MYIAGIFIFDGVDLLDFCAPYELLRVASTDDSPSPGVFRPCVIAEGREPVTSHGGIRVLPEYTLKDHPALDLLLVPGGPGIERLTSNWRVIAWLQALHPSVGLAPICTGTRLLAAAGRSDDATLLAMAGEEGAHHEQVYLCPTDRLAANSRIGNVAGTQAGVDLALRIIERLAGSETAGYAASVMGYPSLPPAGMPR